MMVLCKTVNHLYIYICFKLSIKNSDSWSQHIQTVRTSAMKITLQITHTALQKLPTSRDQIPGTPLKSITHLAKKWTSQHTNSFKLVLNPVDLVFPQHSLFLCVTLFFLVSTPKAHCMTGFDSRKYSPGMKHCSAQLELWKESLLVNIQYL